MNFAAKVVSSVTWVSFLFLIYILLAGCAATPKWDGIEKGMMGAVIVANVADGWTTSQAMDHGMIELNPLYGSHASDTELLAGKAAVAGLTYCLVDLIPSHKWRKVALGASAAISGTAAWHNYQLLRSH